MAKTEHDAWRAPPADWPPTVGPTDALLIAVRYGILAPSPCNTQPWRFHATRDALLVYADASRALAFDPDGREMTIACGAALRNVRLALRHFGYAGAVDVIPDPGSRALIARVAAGGRHAETAEERALFYAIDRRRTNRGEFEARPLPTALLDDLRGCAMQYGAWLALLSEHSDRERLADLVCQADCALATDDLVRTELARWIGHPGEDRRDGLPEHLAPGSARVSGSTGGVLSAVQELAVSDVRAAVHSPAVAVLGTAADDPRDWVLAGEALQHVLLRAAADGVYASYLNQPLRSARSRPWVAQVAAHGGHPQVVLCLGYAPPPEPCPRRPLSDVFAR
jgi:hypothetical protein